MTQPKMLHRGYTEDVLEGKRPSQDSLRRRFGIEEEDGGSGEGEDRALDMEEETEDEEEDEEDSFEMRSLKTPSTAGSQPKSRGAHTMYHGRRQNSFFMKMEKVQRSTVFDDDDSDLDIDESASMRSEMAFGEDGSVVSNLTNSLVGDKGSREGNQASDLSVGDESEQGFISLTGEETRSKERSDYEGGARGAKDGDHDGREKRSDGALRMLFLLSEERQGTNGVRRSEVTKRSEY